VPSLALDSFLRSSEPSSLLHPYLSKALGPSMAEQTLGSSENRA
jgi:hypothetical protein